MTNQRIKENRVCVQCGKSFQPFRSSKGSFCSNQCKTQSRKIYINCLFCTKSFHRKKPDKIYCSQLCYRQAKLARPILDRILENIVKTETCWVWQGKLNRGGYGRIQNGDKVELVHRVMYQIENPSENIADKVIRHFVCDNPPCCNPAHLLSGTIKDNFYDAKNKKRHAHGETSYAKLTEKQVLKIKQDARKDQEIADEYGVARKTINHIKRGSTWKHLL